MKEQSIFLLSPITGPRIKYVVAELFERRLGLEVEWVKSLNEIPPGEFFISYGIESGRICIPESKWLHENTNQFDDIQPSLAHSIKAENRHIWNLDILGFSFCLLSRLEETMEGPKDNHMRFPFSHSLLAKNNQHESPWIDIWVFTLGKQLLEWGIQVKSTHYEEVVSFDIDNPTAFLHKGYFRNLGGILGDAAIGNLSRLKKRIGTHLGLWNDPYDQFDSILNWLSFQKRRSTFFVWVGDYGPHDKGLNWKNRHFRKILEKIAEDHEIGLHPSYRVLVEPNRLFMEKERLEKIIEKPIFHSRFHFLRFQIPSSYKNLIEAGFESDHSMGFSNTFGFRAGTSRAFRFYDVKMEKETSLLVQPFSLMDSTAFYSLNLSQEDWDTKIIHFRNLLKSLNGRLDLVLHNDVSFHRYLPYPL